jgi:hypothetical protein
MVIISNQVNRLGNRLFTFAHVIANAREHHYTVLNPAFLDYAHFFESTRRNVLCRYPVPIPMPAPGRHRERLHLWLQQFQAKWPHRVWLHSWVQLLDISQSHDLSGVEYDLAGPEFDALRRQSRVLIIGGWLFRDNHSFPRHAQAIRQYFTPVGSYRSHITQMIAAARRNCDVLVGVHVRQGDYASFMGGRYFLRADQYSAVMRRALDLWPGQKVHFFVCSDVQQPAGTFDAVPHSLGSGHIIEDLYALAACDYLMAVPSTFSMWASFYGSVPILSLTEAVPSLDLSQFHTFPA